MDYTLIEEKLGISIPKELTVLVTNGTLNLEEYNIRFLEPEEIIEEYTFLKEESSLSFDLSILPFLTDDNSNFIGVYCSGFFQGMLVYLDHENLDFTPAFESLGSFTNYLEIYKPEHIGEEKEYPKIKSTEEDLLLFFKSLENYRNIEDYSTRMYWAFCALNFIPNNEPSILRAFLLSDNMWVQEKACEIIRTRKDYRFVEDLCSIVDFSSTQTNKNIAAINTLGELGTEECKKTLVGLIERKATGNYGIYLLNALGKCGVKTKKVPNQIKDWEYYFLNEENDEWLKLE